MLVKYIWDGQNRIGCIVGIDAEHIGVSICNPKDKFNKKVAKDIAEGRAMTGSTVHIPRRLVNVFEFKSTVENDEEYTYLKRLYSTDLKNVVEQEVESMKERCVKYFKREESL